MCPVKPRRLAKLKLTKGTSRGGGSTWALGGGLCDALGGWSCARGGCMGGALGGWLGCAGGRAALTGTIGGAGLSAVGSELADAGGMG